MNSREPQEVGGYSWAQQRRRRGFTLVEVMIVVALIALLNSLLVPAIGMVRREVYARRLANDFRVMRDACEVCITKEGKPPPDETPGKLPAALKPYLSPKFLKASVVGGALWDWENWTGQRRNFELGITLRWTNKPDMSLMRRVDEVLDDGDLATGSFRQETHFQGFAYILK